jgi:hypothetical protein
MQSLSERRENLIAYRNRLMATKRHGFTAPVYGMISIVIMGMVLILGALVFFAFSNSIPTGLVTGAQQSTLNSIVNTGASALSLLEVVLIVAAAGLIIFTVLTYMSFGRRALKAIKATDLYRNAQGVWTRQAPKALE